MHFPEHSFATGSDTPSRNQIRAQLRDKRRRLSRRQQDTAAASLARQLMASLDLFHAKHVAIYLPNDGEIDPGLFVREARKRGVHFYLPTLHPIHYGTLVFSPYNQASRLRANRFGIPEPEFHKGLKRPPWALDAILMPLVGFDLFGGRLGMGGGFYDRTFAFTRNRPRLAPKLIGLAHDFQQVEWLPIEPWDVPLHSVVTDRGCYRMRRNSDRLVET